MQLYNSLFTGSTLQLAFHTKADAENCRVALSKVKKEQDDALQAADLQEASERPALSFITRLDEATGMLIATLRFRPREVKLFTVVSVTDNV